VMKMLVFKQGQPEDTVELTYDLSKLERANYHALRKELSRDIGIAREVDKWHDAGRFNKQQPLTSHKRERER
jgi:hypothetical protein